MSQYAFSLDAMLGREILQNLSIVDQPLIIKIALIIFVMMISIGFISNSLSWITFKQPKVREFGCGLYLFCLPIIGQLGLTGVAGRFFYFLCTQIYNVDNHLAARWSCISLEYVTTVSTMLFDLLTACIAVERSVNIIKGTSFKKADSVWWAKCIILVLIIILTASAWHEIFIRHIIDDPRAISRHTWCVVMFPWKWLESYRLTINLINLIIPSLINLIATLFLLHKSTKMKQTLSKDKKKKTTYFIILKKQLPFYGSPFGIVIFSLIRLIFLFTLTCIKYQWQKYLYLIAYFISFLPFVATFPIFILPAKIYKTEFKNVITYAAKKLKQRQI